MKIVRTEYNLEDIVVTFTETNKGLVVRLIDLGSNEVLFDDVGGGVGNCLVRLGTKLRNLGDCCRTQKPKITHRKEHTDAKPIEYCEWTPEENDSNWYESECGMSFVFEDGGPTYNTFIYCPKCGKLLKEIPYQEQLDLNYIE